MTETLGITRTGYKKILTVDDIVVYQKPDGKFCSSRAYNESETKTTTPLRASERGQERDMELGRVKVPGAMPPKVYTVNEVLEEWKEEEGKGWIGGKGEELEGESP